MDDSSTASRRSISTGLPAKQRARRRVLMARPLNGIPAGAKRLRRDPFHDFQKRNAMSAFTNDELRYLLGERRLARLATVGKDGTPHVTPVGWTYNAEHDTIDISGHSLERTKKYRDVLRTGRAAVVIDDVLPPWKPRGVEIRGRAEALDQPASLIRIYPERIVSWGIHNQEMGRQ